MISLPDDLILVFFYALVAVGAIAGIGSMAACMVYLILDINGYWEDK